jgi:hypothetical protein
MKITISRAKTDNRKFVVSIDSRGALVALWDETVEIDDCREIEALDQMAEDMGENETDEEREERARNREYENAAQRETERSLRGVSWQCHLTEREKKEKSEHHKRLP